MGPLEQHRGSAGAPGANGSPGANGGPGTAGLNGAGLNGTVSLMQWGALILMEQMV